MGGALAECRATVGNKDLGMIDSRPLIVRLRNYVGDAVLGLPALRLLQRHGYQLQLVGKGWARELFEAEGWPVAVRPKALGEQVRQLRALRAQARAVDPGFDRRLNTLVMPWSFSAALDTRLAGLRTFGHASEARSFLMSRTIPLPPEGQHSLRDYWDLASAFLGVSEPVPGEIGLRVTPERAAEAEALLQSRGIRPGFVLICPFASGKVEFIDRSWPAFPEFVQKLDAAGTQIVICPGPGPEVEGAQRLYPQALRLEGVSLALYPAVLARARVVVANDTGPAHLAAAVGARLISVLGPTNPDVWAPWGPNVELIRRWPAWPSADDMLARVSA
jgi:heptosyltransferase-2